MKFQTLHITEPILKAVKEQGYVDPTPIQEQAIPYALQGRDILGCAQTGTGKTAAFSIPTIQLLKKHYKQSIRSLIVTPTRELAIQIQENITAYAQYTTIRSAVIFGGVPQKPQERILKAGVDILVATPGRLNDLIQQGIIDISHIEIFILDEADRMLDMGFLPDVKRIIAKLPKRKQTLFFSATMPSEIRKLAQSLLHELVSIEVTPASTTVEKIDQSLYYVDKANKKRLLLKLLQKNRVQNALVFTRTKSNANRLAKYLNENGVTTGVIHGNKSQNARQQALLQFKEGKSRVLVATDIAARGIDVQELSHVFNFDIPNEAEVYVHRIGRTGRAGRQGCAIAFSDCNEAEYVKNIEKLIRMHIPVVEDREFPMRDLEPAASAQSQNRRRQKPAAKPSVSNRSENRSAAMKTQTSAATPKRNNRRRRPQSQKQPAHTA
ncbi:DEAD/DEAH box helicase [[Clostridium] innocuum]|uniref:DEAD/DEAH box helicase n=1 Tax=Clostridium innocuum TaxID=1522 RepID=UPI003A4DC004